MPSMREALINGMLTAQGPAARDLAADFSEVLNTSVTNSDFGCDEQAQDGANVLAVRHSVLPEHRVPHCRRISARMPVAHEPPDLKEAHH